jgi:hypothetical protein
LPKTGLEPILKSYKESVLPIKLSRLLVAAAFAAARLAALAAKTNLHVSGPVSVLAAGLVVANATAANAAATSEATTLLLQLT